GNAGVVTALLTDTLGLGGFSLYSMTGLALVYLYFLVPLMVLTITPALEALRPQWREAADNLGATGWQYWRHVGGPVLFPPVLGATMLLFASSFAAYATAKALVGSSVPLVTLQIADALSSNVIVGSENLGKALALGMVLPVVVVLVLMVPTVVLVDLRLPRWRTTVELLTLLPLVLPPIALVVGVRSVLEWAPDYFYGTPLASAMFALQDPALPWILVLVYGV